MQDCVSFIELSHFFTPIQRIWRPTRISMVVHLRYLSNEECYQHQPHSPDHLLCRMARARERNRPKGWFGWQRNNFSSFEQEIGEYRQEEKLSKQIQSQLSDRNRPNHCFPFLRIVLNRRTIQMRQRNHLDLWCSHLSPFLVFLHRLREWPDRRISP